MKKLRKVAFLALLAAAACDSGPEGPGDLTGFLSAPEVDLGGSVLEVVGSGIVGFSGQGGSKVFWAQQDNPSVYRVVVVGPEGADPAFSVTVEDVGRRFPRAMVVSLVDRANQPVPVTKDYEVRFRR
jgi:hypothetical protein